MNNYEQQDLFQTPKESTSLPAPTLVSRFPLQARKGAKKIQDTSGQKYIDSLEMTGFVQCTFLEKTLVDILDKVSTPYQRTWSAVVTDGGVLVSKQRVSELTTKDKESGGSQKIWPTPRTRDYKGGSGTVKEKEGKYYRQSHTTGAKFGVTLDALVEYQEKQKMWPTPNSSPATTSQTVEATLNLGKRDRKQGQLMEAVVDKMWPTPTQDMTTERKKKYAQGGKPLTMAVQEEQQKMWPTPAARDHKDTGENTDYEKLAKKSKLSGAVKSEMYPTPRASEVAATITMEAALNRIEKTGYKANLEENVALREQEKMFLTPGANEDAAGRPRGGHPKRRRMLGNSPEVRNCGLKI